MSLAGIFRLQSFLKRSFCVRAVSAAWANLCGSEGGAEILEFAISLPLLIVVAVGVFDFGSAFTVKQKVGNTALQGARIASNQPTADLSLAVCGVAPASICAVRDVVESNLVASGLNDCGLGTAPAATGTPPSPGPPPVPPNPGVPLTWNFVASGCPGNLYLTIERGFTYTVPTLSPPFQAGPYTIEGTRVTLSYPYPWRFNRVAPLIAPGANFPTTQISSVSIMQNLN